MKEKSVLVIGATGKQGRAVIHALHKKRDFVIRGLVRNPKSDAAKLLAQQGTEIVQGDLDDTDSLEKAMQGMYGVFSYQNMEDGVDKEVERGKRVAHVAKYMGILHFIYSSVGGADRNVDVSYFQSKRRIEDHIRELELEYTILRPVAFMDNFAIGYRDVVLNFFRSALKDKPVQLIAVADVGKWVAHAFALRDAYNMQEIEIAGDELTYAQIEAAYLKVEGKKPKTLPMVGALVTPLKDTRNLYSWMWNEGYQANIPLCKSIVKDMLTFEQWLTLKHNGSPDV